MTDRYSKPAIIFTLCAALLLMLSVTLWEGFNGRPVTEQNNHLVELMIIGLLGLLGKTASDPPAATAQNPVPVSVSNSPADPVEVHTNPDLTPGAGQAGQAGAIVEPVPPGPAAGAG